MMIIDEGKTYENFLQFECSKATCNKIFIFTELKFNLYAIRF